MINEDDENNINEREKTISNEDCINVDLLEMEFDKEDEIITNDSNEREIEIDNCQTFSITENILNNENYLKILREKMGNSVYVNELLLNFYQIYEKINFGTILFEDWKRNSENILKDSIEKFENAIAPYDVLFNDNVFINSDVIADILLYFNLKSNIFDEKIIYINPFESLYLIRYISNNDYLNIVNFISRILHKPFNFKNIKKYCIVFNNHLHYYLITFQICHDKCIFRYIDSLNTNIDEFIEKLMKTIYFSISLINSKYNIIIPNYEYIITNTINQQDGNSCGYFSIMNCQYFCVDNYDRIENTSNNPNITNKNNENHPRKMIKKMLREEIPNFLRYFEGNNN